MTPQSFESFPVFGDNGNKVQPGEQKYAAGFIPGDVLPAEWLNWFLNTLSKGYNQLVQHANEGFTQTITATPADPLTPTQEMSIVINTASVTLTLGNGPYVGYTLPVLATAACSVAYTGSGGSTSMAMPSGSSQKFTWLGSYWQSNLDLIYPVGSIYMSVNNASPGTFLGGTWEQIKDTFLLSAGDTYAAGSSGGAATVTLTVDQIPAHSHSLGVLFTRASTNYDPSSGWSPYGSISGSSEYYGGTQNKGGGQAHNNMPPYLTVYMWKRTA